jgi:hypothetical protein
MTRTKILSLFVEESNLIEGIKRAPSRIELDAHERLLGCERVCASDLAEFVLNVANERLRDQWGMNAIVGDHKPPVGGPQIPILLEGLLVMVDMEIDPWRAYNIYETLQPFMDGNGRSGRALWLWQMIHQVKDPHVLSRGFLHTFYYQTLANYR